MGIAERGNHPLQEIPTSLIPHFSYLLCYVQQIRNTWWYIIVSENGRFNIYKNYITEKYSFSPLFPSKRCPDVFYDKAKEKPARTWLQTPVAWERSLNHISYWVATPRLEQVISMPKLVSPNIIIITASSWFISTTVKSVFHFVAERGATTLQHSVRIVVIYLFIMYDIV